MKLRKLLALALCVAALVCSLSVTAYAVEPVDDPPADTIGAEGNIPADTGDPVETTQVQETTTTIQEITGGMDSDNPLTPDGTGTVLDNATDGDGKEFFTVTTEDGAVFYLVVDRQKEDNNVYFLNAVTLEDLAALAESSGKPLAGPAAQDPQAPVEPTTDPAASPEPSAPAGQETPQQTSPVNIGMLIAALAVLAVGGVAGWYFKIYRPKHQKPAELEDYPEDEEELDPLAGADGWDEDGDGQE